MSTIKVLVAEDEAPQRQALVAMLHEVWPAAEVVAACGDGQSALEAFDREAPNVAFLDIRMPGPTLKQTSERSVAGPTLERTSERSVAGLGGIDLALRFGHRAHIVFVTAYDEYAVRAFELGAIDYLLKPIAPARLRETVQRLVERGLQHPPAIDALLATLRRELTPSAPRDRLKWITASLGETTKLYAVDDVIAFRAQDKYTLVVTAADEAIIRTSLRELVQKLDPDEFWQIHRSVVVRAAAIDQIKRDELGKSWLTLRGRTEQLPVSSTFAARFRGM